MGRYTGAVCRLCRVAKEKLFLKGERCFSPKCTVEKRDNSPGRGSKWQSKPSDYGIRVQEKQKLRRMFGVNERQFSRFFKMAARKKGVTGEILLTLLERRLDNIVFKMGFANSRPHARQLVTHKFFYVNGRKVNIPSYLVKEGEVIEVDKNKIDKLKRA
ncbi:MAG TPA: 30S ribosomal protein S4, partial [Candidatus Omnitrophica bacterium]|nr:30S ribosomal protein S4 [Candidatus Omnitrophota bacterium]